jgi:hypothetical protein
LRKNRLKDKAQNIGDSGEFSVYWIMDMPWNNGASADRKGNDASV